MPTQFMLSTIDNPFNPFEDFASWFRFDSEKNYNSSEYVARLANYKDDMTQREIDMETERAIDKIIFYDPIGIYIKVPNKATMTT
jgi:hypothetical protein